MKYFTYLTLILFLAVPLSRQLSAHETNNNYKFIKKTLASFLLEDLDDIEKIKTIDIDGMIRNNEISNAYRVRLYKAIIERSDMGNWTKGLKSLVLLRLYQYDEKNVETPAYLSYSESISSLMKIVNNFIKHDFRTFAEEKKRIEAEVSDRGGFSNSKIEFSDEVINAYATEVYNKNVKEISTDISTLLQF